MKRLGLLLTLLLLFVAIADAQIKTPAAHIRFGSSLPATCTPNTGDVFFKTSATIGLYQCLTTNTWTAVPSSSGVPGGSTTQVQYNNAGAFAGVSGATSNGTNITFGS